MINRYPIGTNVSCNEITGVVIPTFKLPDDICIEWETGQVASYDEDWLDENVTIVA